MFEMQSINVYMFRLNILDPMITLDRSLNRTLVREFIPRLTHFTPREVLDRPPQNPNANNSFQRSHQLHHVDLKMVSINADSIMSRTQMRKLERWIRRFDYDVILVQETSLNPNQGLPWTLNGYQLVANDDKTSAEGENPGKNGGTCIFVKAKFKDFCRRIPFVHNFKLAQICGVTFDRDISIINIYKSPNQTPDEAVDFANYLIEKIPRQNVIVMGDLNLRDWNAIDRFPKERRQRVIVKAFDQLELIQHVTEPTHGENILDLCLTYNNDKIREVFVEQGWVHYDDDGKPVQEYHHKPVVCIFASRPNYQEFYEVKNYHKVDIEKYHSLLKKAKIGQNRQHCIEHFLVVKHGTMNTCICGKFPCTKLGLCKCGKNCSPMKEIDERQHELQSVISKAFDEASPTKKVFYYQKNLDKHGPKTIRQMKRISRLKNQGRVQELLEEQMILEDMISEDLNQEARNLMKFWHADRNNVYRTIKNEKKNKPKIEGLYRDVHNEDFTVVYDKEERAEILKEHSTKVLQNTDAFAVNFDELINGDDDAPFPARFREPEITVPIVLYFIEERCKEKMAIGPCGCSMIMLKKASEIIAIPLTHLYKMAYSYKYSPKPWNTSKIIYIPKKASDLANPNNLRGLNVPSPFYLGYDFLVCDSMYVQVEEAQLFHDCQWGMRNDRSCETQLIHFEDFVTKHEQGSNGSICLWTDFSKAFDKCCHQRTLERMEQHRFPSGTCKCFQYWLGNSTQYVQVEDAKSEEVVCRSSIKQGTVFAGKVAFNIIINGVFDIIHDKAKELGVQDQIKMACYCDDTKIFMYFKHGQSKQSQLKKFQIIIDTFIKWADDSRLKLNPDKCVAMVKLISDKILKEVKLMFGETPLKLVDQEVDLGCTITKNKGVTAHVKKKSNVAMAVIKSIKHIVPRLTYDLQLQLWNSLVRSTCIYASFTMFPNKFEEKRLYRRVFKTYWRMSRGKFADHQKKPITILQMMVIRDLMWFRDSLFENYPKDLKPEPLEVNYGHHSIRLNQRLHVIQKRTFPTAGSLALTRSIMKLKKRRRQSFRYRNIDLFRQIPANMLYNLSRSEFKDYLKNHFIHTYDETETKLVDMAFEGKIREQFMKSLKWKNNLNKTVADDVAESDTEDECDDPTVL